MSNLKYNSGISPNKTFIFKGEPDIATGMKYNLQFATNNSEKYMNIYMGSSGFEQGSSSSVCLSKEQMLEVRDHINKIYPPESNQSSEKSEPKPKSETKSVSILFLDLVVVSDNLYGKDAEGRLYLIDGTSARPVTLA